MLWVPPPHVCSPLWEKKRVKVGKAKKKGGAVLNCLAGRSWSYLKIGEDRIQGSSS